HIFMLSISSVRCVTVAGCQARNNYPLVLVSPPRSTRPAPRPPGIATALEVRCVLRESCPPVAPRCRDGCISRRLSVPAVNGDGRRRPDLARKGEASSAGQRRGAGQRRDAGRLPCHG